MKINFPSDTPGWLIKLVEDQGDAVMSAMVDVTATPEKLFEARGAARLFRKISEEIDVMGRAEALNNKKLAEEATKRG